MLNEVVIVSAIRTAIGKYGGSLRDVPAITLGKTVIESVLEKAGIAKEMVDLVVMGNCFDSANVNIARIASIKAGIPVETPAYSIAATCASAMQAIISGVQSIREGCADVIIAGGVESMSSAPYLLNTVRWGQRLRHGKVFDLLWKAMQEYPIGDGMGVTAENLAEKYGITREEQDNYALLSQQRACKAVKSGRFKEEIVPVVSFTKKDQTIFDTDEDPKPDVTLESLSKLPPVFKKEGTVTAGNACGMNDAAAAVLIMNSKKADELGVKPLCKIVGKALVGVDPAYMGIGPVPASKQALEEAGLSLNDIQLFEINEAFAAQYLSCERELELNREIVNVNGSGISLGHPVGATERGLL